MLETFSMYLKDFEYNQYGNPLPWFETVSAILIVTTRCLIKVVLLLCAHGYSLSFESIPMDISIFGCAYFLLLFVESVLIILTDYSFLVQFVFLVVEGIIYSWILYDAWETWNRLVSKKQEKKIKLIKHFMICVIGWGFVNFIWFIYEKSRVYRDNQMQWQSLWVLNSFYFAIQFGFLLALMIVWRPSDAFQFEYSVYPEKNLDESNRNDLENTNETDAMIEELEEDNKIL